MNERMGAKSGGDETEIIGEIERGPFAHDDFRAILKQFGRRAFARSAACMEFRNFLYRIRPRWNTCLEIGTYHGITAVVLSQFFPRVIAISLDEEPAKLLKHEIVAHLGITNIEFIDVKSNEEKEQLVKSLDFDFAFVDGDHAHDAQFDFDLVRGCGRVLQHEAWPLQASVWNLLHSLPAKEVTWAMHDCFAYWQRKDAT